MLARVLAAARSDYYRVEAERSIENPGAGRETRASSLLYTPCIMAYHRTRGSSPRVAYDGIPAGRVEITRKTPPQ